MRVTPMKHALHKFIPNWMVSAITSTTCNQCHQPVNKEDILGLGVKEVKEYKISIFVEYQCSNCNHAARMNFSSQVGSVEEICYLLLDELQKKRKLAKSKAVEEKVSPSKITDDETKKFIKKMNETNSFEDFLKLIGANNLVEKENSNDKPEA
jgi:RNase P subunit RPR2